MASALNPAEPKGGWKGARPKTKGSTAVESEQNRMPPDKTGGASSSSTKHESAGATGASRGTKGTSKDPAGASEEKKGKSQGTKDTPKGAKGASKDSSGTLKGSKTGSAGSTSGATTSGSKGGAGGIPGSGASEGPRTLPGGFPAGFPGCPIGCAFVDPSQSTEDFSELTDDVEIMSALRTPEIEAAFKDISENPANIANYQNNQAVQDLIQKLQHKFGGGVDVDDATDGGAQAKPGGAHAETGGAQGKTCVPETPDVSPKLPSTDDGVGVKPWGSHISDFDLD